MDSDNGWIQGGENASRRGVWHVGGWNEARSQQIARHTKLQAAKGIFEKIDVKSELVFKDEG